MTLSKRLKKSKNTDKFTLIFIENYNYAPPRIPSQEDASEKTIKKQKKIIRLLTLFITVTFALIFFQSGLLKLYIENWHLIEPLSQLIEWVIKLAFAFLNYIYYIAD